MTKAQQHAQADAVARLLEFGIKPGDTIFTILRHRTASGNRSISLVWFDEECQPRQLDYHAAKALGLVVNQRHEGLVTDTCGMDAGFDIVYHLGRRLFPDHQAAYALNHRWL